MKFLSTRTHTIIGLVAGLALLVAPWLFGFADEGGAAVMVPLYVGLFILVSELTTTSTASPLKLVPMRIHLVLDVFTGIFLATSPWLFDFADLEANAWVPHVVVGVLVAGYALFTRTDDAARSIV
jgi:hypothetical protein